MLWKPQAQTLAQTSPCREEAEKKSSDYYKMCCAQCSAVPSPVHAPGFLPSIHPSTKVLKSYKWGLQTAYEVIFTAEKEYRVNRCF